MGTAVSGAGPARLRKALAAKQRRTTTFDVVVSDPTVAEEALSLAQRALRVAPPEEREAAQARVDQAKQDLLACVVTLTFHNLPSHEFEALISAHAPTKEQQDKGDQWNPETFSPALIAACVADSDMTEQEWAEELASKRWSVADRNAIFTAALSANVTARSVTVPKG